jgi:predicted AAA+ superfamily ATPase
MRYLTPYILNDLTNSTGDKYGLHYLRDRTGHEIDFLTQKNGAPIALIEAKASDTSRSRSFYNRERLKEL